MNISFICMLSFICCTVCGQNDFHKYFKDFDTYLDGEYQKLARSNEKESYITGQDLEYISDVIESYKNNVLLFELIIEEGISDCNNDFTLEYIAFYQYGFPGYEYAYCIYKNKSIDFYKGVSFDVSDYAGDGLNNRIISCKYFKSFPKKLDWESNIEKYEYAKIDNIIGFNLLFKNGEIEKAELILSPEDFDEVLELKGP